MSPEDVAPQPLCPHPRRALWHMMTDFQPTVDMDAEPTVENINPY